jgi:hypothetical protein
MKKFKERKKQKGGKEPTLNVFLHLISAKRQIQKHQPNAELEAA